MTVRSRIPGSEAIDVLVPEERALAPERVLQVVVDQHLRGRRDLAAQMIEVDGEAGRSLVVAIWLARPVEVFDLALVDGIPRSGVQHAIASVHHDLQELPDHGLPARLHRNVDRAVADPPAHRRVVGESLAQGGDSRSRAIAGLAFGDRPVHCVDHVYRSRKVDVAKVEREDLVALRAPLCRGERHSKRGFCTKIVQSFSEHGSPSRWRRSIVQNVKAGLRKLSRRAHSDRTRRRR
jgi:hypothetical protein